MKANIICRMLFYLMLGSLCITSCNTKSEQAPVTLKRHSNTIQIPFEDRNNNQVWIPVKMNGVSMDMLYDTGFNGSVSMSLLELQTLAKQGQFSAEDIIGTSYSSIADGSIVGNGVVQLHSLKIADFEIKNVIALVSLNQEAPVLIGREVFNQIARKVEVDNAAKTLNITPW
ncbi:MAG: retroviral-like aspartic protease family protein [Paludibacteraceae bacterium]|nr:retroviral-like aspartic protease family protein [Paludibacteraceae bacterium]